MQSGNAIQARIRSQVCDGRVASITCRAMNGQDAEIDASGWQVWGNLHNDPCCHGGTHTCRTERQRTLYTVPPKSGRSHNAHHPSSFHGLNESEEPVLNSGAPRSDSLVSNLSARLRNWMGCLL